jgi:Lon protease-like protein
MADAEPPIFDPAEFSGRVRLFPLPNLVMFPNVLQPLHVFEPRYRALMEDALADDRLIAMAVLSPGWEADYDGRPAVQPIACLGRIVTHQRLDDGRYNLLLAGLKRVRIDRELPPLRPFREAEVTLVDDVYREAKSAQRADRQQQLLAAFRRFLPKMPEVHQQLDELLCTQISLGMLTDLVAYAVDLPQEMKLKLLGWPDVDRRCETLLRELASSNSKPDGEGRPGWPPDFSKN